MLGKFTLDSSVYRFHFKHLFRLCTFLVKQGFLKNYAGIVTLKIL